MTKFLDNEINQRIGKNIHHLRTNQNLTRAIISQKTGYGVSYLSLLENGHRGISVGGLAKIAEVLRVKPGSLIEEEFYKT